MSESSSQRPAGESIGALVGRAQQAISKAKYAVAIDLLQRALAVAPQDVQVRRLLEQTEEAARRHEAVRARHAAAVDKARQLSNLFEGGEDPSTIRSHLRQAQLEHGRHAALEELEQRLAAHEDEARQRRAQDLLQQARGLREVGEWRQVLRLAEQSSGLFPSAETEELVELARVEIERDVEDRHYRQAVAEARSDVDRLIAARELPRAGERLRQAREQLGNHPAFENLDRQIDKAKSDFHFRQRIEWAERRANEAERLIEEAERNLRQGAYTDAIERLESARQLDPSRPETEHELALAHEARERHLEVEQRTAAMTAREAEIRSDLDGLRLDAAAEKLRRATREFGDGPFVALANRLSHLRASTDPKTLPDSAVGDRQNDISTLARQRALAAAYSWKQTLLYPFRGRSLIAAGAVFSLFLVLDLLAVLPFVGGVMGALGGLVLLAVLGRGALVLRSTLDGNNLVPDWEELLEPTSWLRDGLLAAGLVVLAFLPLLLLLLSRAWHVVLGVDSGFPAWWVAAFFAWLAVVLVVAAWSAGEAFGRPQMLRLSRHFAAVASNGAEMLFAINGLFMALFGIFALRGFLLPSWPWLGIPLVRALEVYLLFLAPHLIGVVVRRHRRELGQIYGLRAESP